MQNSYRLPGFMDATQILADPSIFHATQAQAEGGFKSIADLYSEAGLTGLWEGENAEIAGMNEYSSTGAIWIIASQP